MSRTILLYAAGAAALGALVFLFDATAASSDEDREVFVTNFPETQRIAGAVAVEGTIHQAALSSIREIEVPPHIAADNTRRLVLAGTITTDGFGAVVLSLMVQMRGKVLKPARIGAILVPDEEPILEALDQKSQILFPLEVAAEVPALGPVHLASTQPRYVVGFPRYRVYLYNTSETFATADLYAYLTN